MSVFHQRRSKAGMLVTTCLASNYFRYSLKPDATAAHHTLSYIIIQLPEDDGIPGHSLLFPFNEGRYLIHVKNSTWCAPGNAARESWPTKSFRGTAEGSFTLLRTGESYTRVIIMLAAALVKLVDYLSFGLTMATYLRRWRPHEDAFWKRPSASRTASIVWMRW